MDALFFKPLKYLLMYAFIYFGGEGIFPYPVSGSCNDNFSRFSDFFFKVQLYSLSLQRYKKHIYTREGTRAMISNLWHAWQKGM